MEHRVFSEISKTWAGCPLRTFNVVLEYLKDTKTQTGLTVQAYLVTQTYATGVKVPDAEMEFIGGYCPSGAGHHAGHFPRESCQS
ncbi:MAG: hypothetical protein E4H27_06615 [Anaerolineales bacterium]|nr:MAG: hypothetical protein E4H27_06615 [Anaerolineales bacterium]